MGKGERKEERIENIRSLERKMEGKTCIIKLIEQKLALLTILRMFESQDIDDSSSNHKT